MGIRSLQNAMKGIDVGFHSSTGEKGELAWDICSRSNDCKVEGKASSSFYAKMPRSPLSLAFLRYADESHFSPLCNLRPTAIGFCMFFPPFL